MMVDLEEIRRARDEADCLCDAVEVDAALNRLAADITVRLQDKNPLVYAVMNGGLILAGRLLPRLWPLQMPVLLRGSSVPSSPSLHPPRPPTTIRPRRR